MNIFLTKVRSIIFGLNKIKFIWLSITFVLMLYPSFGFGMEQNHEDISLLPDHLADELELLTISEKKYTAGDFIRAIMKNDHKRVKKLLESGFNAQTRDRNSFYCALVWAAYCGSTECLELFIAANADLNYAEKSGNTPLWVATICGRVPSVLVLLKAGVNPNTRLKDGWTVLKSAAMCNQLECLRIFINAGADVNAADDQGTTVTMWAIHSAECLKCLIDYDANIHAKNCDGYNAVVWALRGNETESVKILFDAALDPVRCHRILLKTTGLNHCKSLDKGTRKKAFDACFVLLAMLIKRGTLPLCAKSLLFEISKWTTMPLLILEDLIEDTTCHGYQVYKHHGYPVYRYCLGDKAEQLVLKYRKKYAPHLKRYDESLLSEKISPAQHADNLFCNVF